MIDVLPDLVGLPRVLATLKACNLALRVVSPGTPMPTVAQAAAAVGCSPDQIIKTVVFSTPEGRAVIAIANGTRRIDRHRLATAAGVGSVQLARPEFVLKRTGYPAGGVSPIGIRDSGAPVIVDEAVLEQTVVFGGAGTEHDLLELSTELLVAVSGAKIALIVQPG